MHFHVLRLFSQSWIQEIYIIKGFKNSRAHPPNFFTSHKRIPPLSLRGVGIRAHARHYNSRPHVKGKRDYKR